MAAGDTNGGATAEPKPAPTGVTEPDITARSTAANLSISLGRVLSRLLRGAILATWICVLGLVALLALTGRASDLLLNIGGSQPVRYYHVAAFSGPGAGTDTKVQCSTPSGALSDWSDPERPPVDGVLDEIAPNWRVRKSGAPTTCSREEAQAIVAYYDSAFDRIDSEIKTLIGDKEVDPRRFEINGSILPADIAGSGAIKDSIVLPRRVADWVLQKRAEREQYQSRHALLDTFLLLTVIGAFGSLIFLIRDYVTGDVNSQIADYVFRPVLGVFLAMSMFIIDVLAQSLLSRSGLETIRYEPLYVLALAAGLLSEQTYQALEARVKSSLEKEAGTSEETPAGEAAAGTTSEVAHVE